MTMAEEERTVSNAEILGGELACEKLQVMIEKKKTLAEEMREYEESEDREYSIFSSSNGNHGRTRGF